MYQILVSVVQSNRTEGPSEAPKPPHTAPLDCRDAARGGGQDGGDDGRSAWTAYGKTTRLLHKITETRKVKGRLTLTLTLRT
jgi:hypothetical protein